MGKRNTNKESAKNKARAYLDRAASDGRFTNREISKATERGLSMDRVLNRAANQGVAIGERAKENYNITQGSNLNRIDYAPQARQTFNPGPTKGQYPASGSPGGGAPVAQKRGVYAGVNKDGAHVYRYGTGQPRQAAQAPATTTPAPTTTTSGGEQTDTRFERPTDSPATGMSWSDYISGGAEPQVPASATEQTQSSATSRPANTSTSYRPDADPNNPDLYGAIASSGQDYQKRFGRFIDYADATARTQAWEVGDAGRQALSRLQATPPKLIDPLSKENARAYNRFYRKLDIG